MYSSIDSGLTDLLPDNDPQRILLHNEVHARPSQRIRLPALVVYVVVINEGITREQECEHLRRLPGQQTLMLEQLQNNFLRLRLQGYTVRWERHSEFTRYSVVQNLPETAQLGATDPELLSYVTLPRDWLAEIPGRTFAAVKLAMVCGDLNQPEELLLQARKWLGGNPVVASLIGRERHSLAVTDFMLRHSGFERMLVIMPAGSSETRAGRVSQRLLEIETYRLMALRGLPVAKRLFPELTSAEQQLADITARLENKAASDQELLDTLIALAARIERATVQHAYRFAATQAYNKLVTQRIAELREQAIPGTQTIGEFMQRRLSPAIATVEATVQRMSYLSARVSRASALLRTRVDILTEAQNQQLLEKLTRGQELQLRLQSTVEGLSIAAISYYVVSLLLYLAKAGKAAGLPVHPELAAGVMIPVVLWAVWRATRRIHDKFFKLH
ncbi:DUF3422 domain-containing protein [Nitrosomonas sp. Is35]|uniref:DUF3422 family protein n=1 Tax=unclassified Nitrosomonas TaxID=2609265 RepID=UPI00294B3D04|nr:MULTISPECIES: DUF3422 domain-containing protein [unclassified Nitrosomonas]MDV6341534.1 DUF3422 domain-containing protein [Nitrosomonas sp. Is24]MDV6347227.1 DUF3422 domain-containing protein [Nitrosomonas sp. Is35]